MDLCLLPSPTDTDWGTLKAQAIDISKMARKVVTSSEAKTLIDSLCRRKLLRTQRNGDFEVTKLGFASLMESVGLGTVVAAHQTDMTMGLVDGLASWLEKWSGDWLSSLFSASSVPFKLPRRRKDGRLVLSIFELWNEQKRAWKIISIVQEACKQEWWITREIDRQVAIFEANQILYHAQVLIAWQSGRIADRHADDVHDERLAVESSQKTRSYSRDKRHEAAFGQPLPRREEVVWEATDNVFRDAFVVPLLRARGLRDVMLRRTIIEPDARTGRGRAPSRSMSFVDLQDGELEKRAFETLARVCHDQENALLLAARAGFPQDRLPRFHSAITFWTKVVQEARHGVLPDGALPIIEAAAEMYPNNPVFAEYRSAYSLKRAAREGDRGRAANPGMDIVGWYQTPFESRRWVAVQVKRTIDGDAHGEHHELHRQLTAAFTAPLPAASGEAVAEVWVVVATYLAEAIQELVLVSLEDTVARANIRFFDRDALERLHDRVLSDPLDQASR